MGYLNIFICHSQAWTWWTFLLWSCFHQESCSLESLVCFYFFYFPFFSNSPLKITTYLIAVCWHPVRWFNWIFHILSFENGPTAGKHGTGTSPFTCGFLHCFNFSVYLVRRWVLGASAVAFNSSALLTIYMYILSRRPKCRGRCCLGSSEFPQEIPTQQKWFFSLSLLFVRTLHSASRSFLHRDCLLVVASVP